MTSLPISMQAVPVFAETSGLEILILGLVIILSGIAYIIWLIKRKL